MIEVGLDRLIAARFEQTGAWRRNEHGQVVCEGSLPKAPGVYVFVVSRIIRYVGSAQRSLSARMKSYERRQRDQKSDRPVHLELGKAIDRDAIVEIYTRVINDPIQNDPDGLPIDYAIGLEAGLIQAVDPAWNRRGRKLVLDDINS